jgi:CDP-diglyceride synthetase
VVVPQRQFNDIGDPISVGGPDPLVLVLVTAAWWLVLALIVGMIGLREANTTDEDPAAGRRAALTRLWAGLVAVIGLATAVTRSDYTYDPVAGNYGRVIEPWIGDLAILVLAAVLVERAFRRDASTFVYAAALGLIIALTDFNFTYLSSSTELGLLIEGVILLGAGVAADRLRRRIGHPEPEPEPEVEAPAAPA